MIATTAPSSTAAPAREPAKPARPPELVDGQVRLAGTSRPLYVELADSLQSLVEQGTLRPGHRVPSVRIMSRQRDVSIATVLQAYTVLENRGYLEARPQSGYYGPVRPAWRPSRGWPGPWPSRPTWASTTSPPR